MTAKWQVWEHAGLRALLLLAPFVFGAAAACGEDDVKLDQHGQSSGGTAGGGASSSTFCDVSPILQAKCERCHADPPVHGAPFPLTTYEDARGTGSGASARRIQIKDAVESGFMPYVRLQLDPPVEPLSCEERTTLLAWLADGAPAAETDCSLRQPRLLACSSGWAGSGGSE